jgi:short chain dehydrogenase
MSLKDKCAVVTGGSRGLGLGLVEALVAEGAKVTVVARGADALDAVKARLGVDTISADVTDRAAANRILDGGGHGGTSPISSRHHLLKATMASRPVKRSNASASMQRSCGPKFCRAKRGYVGALAFCRSGDLSTGDFGDARII